jgi:glycosyltransferase involved in cell wall biosynthesis
MAKYFPLEQRGFRQDCLLLDNNKAAMGDDFPLGLIPLRGTAGLGDVLSGRWLRHILISMSFHREFCYGLEKILGNYDLVRSAEIHYPFTWQCVEAQRGGTAPPVVVTVHENLPHIWGYKPKAAPYIETVRRHARLFIAVSHYSAQLCRQEGIEDERIRVGGNAVDLTRLHPGERDDKLRQRLGAKPDDFLVLALGRLSWEKGQEFLVHAAQALKLRGRSVKVALVGRGSLRSTLERLIAAYGMADSVTILDTVSYEKISPLIRSADCLVQASLLTPRWQEQFGMAALEAMACGVPVITTATGGIPEVVADAGLYHAPGNYVELAAAIDHLHSEPSLVEELVGKGLEQAKHFSLERISSLYGEYFSEVSRG